MEIKPEMFSNIPKNGEVPAKFDGTTSTRIVNNQATTDETWFQGIVDRFSKKPKLRKNGTIVREAEGGPYNPIESNPFKS